MSRADFIVDYRKPFELSFFFTDGKHFKVDVSSNPSKDLLLIKTKPSVDPALNDLSVKILALGNGDASGAVNASDFECECNEMSTFQRI